MSVVQEKIRKEIKTLETNLLERNDANSVLKEIALEASQLGQDFVQKANETGSYDEKIKFLLEGLQGVINLVEEHSEQVDNDVGNLSLQIKTLEDLLEKVITVECDEKKNN